MTTGKPNHKYWSSETMPTHLAIDDELLKETIKVGQFKTKKEAVNTALREFLERRKQLEIIELFGKLDPDPDYDYKQGR